MNLAMPMLQTITAISLLILPHFSSLFARKDIRRFRRTIFIFTIILAIFLTTCDILIAGFRYQVMSWIYKGKYEHYANLTIAIALLPLVTSISTVAGGALRSMEKPEKVFQSFMFTIIGGLPIGLLLIKLFGVSGAVWSMVIMTLISSYYYGFLGQYSNGDEKVGCSKTKKLLKGY